MDGKERRRDEVRGLIEMSVKESETEGDATIGVSPSSDDANKGSKRSERKPRPCCCRGRRDVAAELGLEGN